MNLKNLALVVVCQTFVHNGTDLDGVENCTVFFGEDLAPLCANILVPEFTVCYTVASDKRVFYNVQKHLLVFVYT
jgi:hypothetical protein